MNRDFNQLPPWRRAIIVVLIPFVLPAVVLVFLLLLMVLVWNSCVLGVYWLRWKLLGVPIPPTCPPPSGRPVT